MRFADMAFRQHGSGFSVTRRQKHQNSLIYFKCSYCKLIYKKTLNDKSKKMIEIPTLIATAASAIGLFDKIADQVQRFIRKMHLQKFRPNTE